MRLAQLHPTWFFRQLLDLASSASCCPQKGMSPSEVGLWSSGITQLYGNCATLFKRREFKFLSVLLIPTRLPEDRGEPK